MEWPAEWNSGTRVAMGTSTILSQLEVVKIVEEDYKTGTLLCG